MTDLNIFARVVADSIGPNSPRLTTFLTRSHHFVQKELLRHRAFSFSSQSSRAVPTERLLKQVRHDATRAAPIWWGKEQKGMQSGEELDDTDELRIYDFVSVGYLVWKMAALEAAYSAELLYTAGAHKSIVNRLIEPFLYTSVVITSCEPGLLNFFGLRLDRAAQPEIRVLAEAMWRAWNESTPRKLEPGQWHLPFIDGGTADELCGPEDQLDCEGPEWNNLAIRVSAGRCTNFSYRDDGGLELPSVERALSIADRMLIARPLHASPFEHQATPDEKVCNHLHRNIQDHVSCLGDWMHSAEHGNLFGWRQFRKTLLSEAVTYLPKEYCP